MSDSENRVPCPHCQAANFPSSTTCWQCGQPMNAQQGEDLPPTGDTGTPQVDIPGEPIQQPQPPAGGPIYGAPSPAPRPTGDTSIYIILGFVFSGLGLLPSCCGWPFIVAALVMGIIAYTKGNKTGLWVIGVAVLIFIFNLAYLAYFFKHFGPGSPNMPFPTSPHGSGPFAPHATPLPHATPTPQ